MSDDEENHNLVGILDEHGVDSSAAWKAALELELGERRPSSIERLLEEHGDKALELCSSLLTGNSPDSVNVATDGGAEYEYRSRAYHRPERERLRGSPQRQKFVQRQGVRDVRDCESSESRGETPTDDRPAADGAHSVENGSSVERTDDVDDSDDAKEPEEVADVE